MSSIEWNVSNSFLNASLCIALVCVLSESQNTQQSRMSWVVQETMRHLEEMMFDTILCYVVHMQ